jgi:Ion channel
MKIIGPSVQSDGSGMPRRLRASWTLVLRLTAGLTCIAAFVVLACGTALWLVERDRPNSTVRSWGDALWWSLSTMTTVGYGDHVPVTTTGRLIAAAVMVVGVAVIGGVAAIVALGVALHIAITRSVPSKLKPKRWSSASSCGWTVSRRSWLVSTHY